SENDKAVADPRDPSETPVPMAHEVITCRVLQIVIPFMRGEDVLAVQRALETRGFNPGVIDGIYGPNTETAVRNFQRAAGLPVTGVVCGRTYTLLGVNCACVPPCPSGLTCRVLQVQSPLMSGGDVLAVQQALAARGFNPGTIDGVYGPNTAAAVRAFQRARSLPVTGVVCGQTYVLLEVNCISVPPCPSGIVCRVLELQSPLMHGEDVLAVQRALAARGFNPGPIDGVYGNLTASAVRSFQSSRGLPVTGVVCGQTYVLLCVPCSTVPPCPPGPAQCRVLVTTKPFMSGPDVLAVQEALSAHGFSPGAHDGVYGPRTATAVREFQASRGLPVTGVVCDGLYSTLGVGCPTVPPCPVNPPVSTCRRLFLDRPFLRGSDVAAVQAALANRGFNPGAVDGVYGPNTFNAVKEFQIAAGLRDSGVVCSLEYRALLINCLSFPSC
ncbi:MAG: peptidoglycan-binding protein, partial [Bacillota bacterium]